MIVTTTQLPAWERRGVARMAELCQEIGASELVARRARTELIRRLAAHPIGQQRPRELERLAIGINSICQTAPGASNTGSIYSPRDEGDAVTAFDMLDPTSFTQAGTVTSITNKLSGVAWTEATNPPAYAATGLSGQPCMDFNGTTHRIISTEAAVFGAVSAAASYSLYIVASCDVADLSTCIFGVGSAAEATNRSKRWGTFTTSTGVWIYSQNNDAGTNTSTESAEANNTSPVILAFRSGATNLTLSANNVAQTMSGSGAHGTGALTPTRSALGCLPRSTPGAFFDGKLGELWLFAAELDASANSRVYTYLSARWGI